jgi:type I restriction enzyme M protein
MKQRSERPRSSREATHRSVDLLGRVYEYFLTRFASAEGKNGGQFYTPSCVVRCLVEMLAPYKGRIYDPCCGSGGMFVQSEKFVESHGGKLGDISIYGQESNATTRRLAIMNLAIRGIEADIGPEHADTFRRDLHPDLRADYVLANPPFNDSDWFRKDDDVRWQFGVPPKGNANFAWVQHFIHHLAPQGMAGFVLANGSMSSNQSGEGEIRRALIEADLVDCMVALPRPALLQHPDSGLPLVPVANKEARETNYWLRLLAASDVVPSEKLTDITDESNQLIAILTTIVKRSRGSKS